MRRRELLAGMAALVSVSRPFRAHGQQAARRPRVGVLIYSTPERDPNTRAFLDGLRQLGYVDGQNITIEYRYAQGEQGRMPSLVTELLQLKVDFLWSPP